MQRIRCLMSKPLAVNSAANASSSAGWVFGLSARMSSIGLTMPRPKKLAQTLLTIALAKYGFFGDVTQLARTGRYSYLPTSLGVSPWRKRAGTVFPFVSGMTAAPFAAAAFAAIFSAALAAFSAALGATFPTALSFAAALFARSAIWPLGTASLTPGGPSSFLPAFSA